MKNSNHNKQWDDLNPKLVIDGGGELLERMNLPRRGFEVMSFLEAHGNKHKFDFSDVGRRRAYGPIIVPAPPRLRMTSMDGRNRS